MKLSWSHKLFLRINNQIGKRPSLDRFMVFCAKWLIYFFVLFLLFYYGIVYGLTIFLPFLFLPIIAALLVVLGVNYTVGFIFRKKTRRPYLEIGSIRTLIELPKFEDWKTFPSDHAALSFFFSTYFVLYFFHIPFLHIVAPLLYLIAIFVSMGRVYVGVHYPRDVMVGAFIGVVVPVFLYFVFYGTEILF